MEAQLKLMALDDIEINEANPRRGIEEESLKELAASIASVGVIQPVVVTRRDGKNLLVTGERRVRASILAGLEEIPAVERDLSDKEILEIMLIENLQRSNLAPLEEADALNRLVHDYGWKQKDLADRVGRSPGWLSKRIRLLALPEVAQEALGTGKISIEDALELLRLCKWPERIIETLEKDWYGRNMKAKVDSTLIEIQRDIAVENVCAELEAKGKRTWRGSFESYFYVRSREQAMGLNKEQEKEHKKEKRECLAYAVNRWDASVRPVCTDPDHWKKEMHEWETDQHEREKAEHKAKEKARLAAAYEVMHQITGSLEEVEAVLRRQALDAVGRPKTTKTAARAFRWKQGRRLDTARLQTEIRKAKGKELRRICLVALACEQLSYSWRDGQVLTIIKELRQDGEGRSAEAD